MTSAIGSTAPPGPVAVVIPTLRRRASLTRALISLFQQNRAAELIAEIIVVDNAPEGSAREAVEGLRPASPAPLIYVHEPRPGVATARNAGVGAVSRSDYVAFLDDDEEAPPGWLAALTRTHLALGADVTFGTCPRRGGGGGVAQGLYRGLLLSNRAIDFRPSGRHGVRLRQLASDPRHHAEGS